MIYWGNNRPSTYNLLLTRAKRLMTNFKNTGGRNFHGRITSYKTGHSRYRRLIRFVDFWRRLAEDAFVVKIIKDPFRSVSLSLIFYQTGFLSFVVLPEGFLVGDKVKSSFLKNIFKYKLTNQDSTKTVSNIFDKTPLFGLSLPISMIETGYTVFNIELWPFKGAQICRSAGTSAVLLTKYKNYAVLKLRSGWRIVISDKCVATIGVAPNIYHMHTNIGKAGTNINTGRRMTVRGVAMNAIDHPHGGGRGKTSGGPRPLSPWGKITKKRKTVSKKLRAKKLKIRFR